MKTPGTKTPTAQNTSWAVMILLIWCISIPSDLFAQVCNETEDFSQPIMIGPTQAADTWYTDRYAPNDFVSDVAFLGNDRLLHGIDVADGAVNRPGGFQTAFYNTQGRKYDLPAATKSTQIDLYVPSAWQTTNKRMAGFWCTAFDGADAVSAYPILEFTSDAPGPRFRVWESGGAGAWMDIGLPGGFVYDQWYTLIIELLPTGEFLYTVGDLQYTTNTSSLDGSVRLANVILQGHNYDPTFPLDPTNPGVTYDIHWDNLTISLPKVTNMDSGDQFCTIQEAIDDTDTDPGHTLIVQSGYYNEVIVDNKGLTIRGPNVGIPGTGVRNTEAVLYNCSVSVTSAGTTVIDGFHIYQTNNTADAILLGGSATASIQNCILERFGITTGAIVRAITTSAGSGVKTIQDNLFTGDVSGGLFGGHKTWNSGMYVNGAGSTVNIFDNTFQNCRSALNLDDYNSGITLSGNTLNNNGTHLSFGGVVPTAGAHVLGANDFGIPLSAIINLSNVATSFRLDMTTSSFLGMGFNTLLLGTLLNVEAGMYHRGRSGKNGLVYYVANNQYVVDGLTTIQSAVDYAASGDVINVGIGTYDEHVIIDLPVTIDGSTSNCADVVIEGGNVRTMGVEVLAGILNVALRDFSVQNTNGTSDHAGVRVRNGCDGLDISNLCITDTKGRGGIYIDGDVDGVDIDGCEVSGTNVDGRGIVIWNGFKENISITDNYVHDIGGCCGIELQDGNASAVTMTGNTVERTSDSGMSAVGLNGTTGANTISGNTIENTGRFGLEIKNPNGNGSDILVDNNEISIIGSFATLKPFEERDIAGIAVHRRGVLAGNVDVPTGVTVTNNDVTGYIQDNVNSDSEGFGIVIEGTNHTVNNNTVESNDVGIQQQAGHTPYPGDGNQNDLVDTYFGRGNSPQTCANTISGNTYNSNGLNERSVGVGGGIVTNLTTLETYCSIQDAIDDASTMTPEVISVPAGTFAENLTINKALTLSGANAGTPCNEWTETPAVISVTSGVPVSITSDGVTIDGFEITAPNSSNAIIYTGRSDVSIINNRVHDVGTSFTGGPVHAILSGDTGSGMSDIVIHDNCINDVASSSLTGFSASAIGVLQSPSTGVLSNLSIQRNTIENVIVNDGAWPTGKIAYGIQINVGGNASYLVTTGKVTDAVINQNEISNLSGHIATGIGLEGNTEDAIVTNNLVEGLSGTKLAAREGGGYDINGLKFENNRYVSTVTVDENSFETSTYEYNGTPDLGYAVANYVPAGDGGTADLGCNWYGTAVYNEIEDNVALTGKILNKVGAVTDFVPYLNSGVDNAMGTIGFQPAGMCNGTPVEITSTVVDHITCSEPTGEITVSWSGGATPYEIDWTGGPGAMSISSPYQITGLSAGSYDITVTDVNGTTATVMSVTISYFPVHNTTQDLLYTTIQAAITAASDDDVIEVCPGTYPEVLTINKPLTVNGAGSGSNPATNTVLSAPVSCAGTGLAISANNVTVSNMYLENYFDGIVLTSTTATTVNNVRVINACRYGMSLTGAALQNIDVLNSEFSRTSVITNTVGIRVGTGTGVDDFRFENSILSGWIQGVYITNESSPGGPAFNNILFLNSTISGNSQKGMYFEKLSNAMFDGLTMDNNGTDMGYGFNNGIDINLKWNAFSNITIQNCDITNSGVTGIAGNVDNPAALTIKARDDASSYNGDPATLTGVLIKNNKITGPQNGIRIGEFGKVNATPTSVVIEGNDLSHAFANKAVVSRIDADIVLDCNWHGTTDLATILADLSEGAGGDILLNDILDVGTDGSMDVGFQPSGNCTCPNGNLVTRTSDNATFCSIQAAIDDAGTVDGNTLEVGPGIYIENILLNKELHLHGNNFGVNPNTEVRDPESILYPATSDPDPNSVTAVNMLYLTEDASGSTIDGFLFDGDNPDLTSGVVSNGADLDAIECIAGYDGTGNLTISNNILQNVSYAGIDLYNYYNNGAVTTNNSIVENKIDNIRQSPYGIGILIYNNFYAEIENNVITRVRVGVQTGNFYLANTGSTNSISSNAIESERRGLFHNLAYGSASTFDIVGNTITTVSGALNHLGISLSSLGGVVGANVMNNSITGAYAGIDFWNCTSTNTITVTGGNIIGCQYGVVASNYDGYVSNANSSSVRISGVNITGSSIAAVHVKDNPLNSNGATIHLTVDADCEIAGTGQLLTGIWVTGSDASATIQNNDASINGFAIGIDVDGGSATITNNHIYDNGTGVRFINFGSGTVTNNHIHDNGVGVQFTDDGTGDVNTNNFDGGLVDPDNGTDLQATASAGAVNATPNNSFAGNTYGVENLSGLLIDATLCYWESPSGPAPNGSGAAVTTNVDYCPWLADVPVAFGGTGVTADGPFKNLTNMLSFCTLQEAINDAGTVDDDVIQVLPGNYTEIGQIVISKDLTIVGTGSDCGDVVFHPDMNTTSSGDGRGWWLVQDGKELSMEKVTLDGTGFLIWQAIRHKGFGDFDQVCFENILYQESGPSYSGVAVAAFGVAAGSNVNIENSTFTNIGRVGVLYFGAGVDGSLFDNNTYTGKGAGDWLDYALDISAGAQVTATNNTVSGNLGVASSDGSGSAGILVSTFFAGGTSAAINNNDLSGNSIGLAVGFDGLDASIVEAHQNDLSNNPDGGVINSNPSNVVDATLNWWGHASGPGPVAFGTGVPVSNGVLYCPWLDDVPPAGMPVNAAAFTIDITENSGNAANDGEICIGDMVTLDATTPNATYLWAPGGETTASITVSPVITTLYSATVTVPGGCDAVQSTTITVHPLPVFTLEANGDPVTEDEVLVTCVEDDISLEVTGDVGATYALIYDGDSAAFGNVNGPAFLLPACIDEEGEYTLVVTSDEGCTEELNFVLDVNVCPLDSDFEWVYLPEGSVDNANCPGETDCCTNTFCFELQYTPGVTGTLISYTTGFFVNCVDGNDPIISNASCIPLAVDNSNEDVQCMMTGQVLFNSSANFFMLPVTTGSPVVLHKICFNIPTGESIEITEDILTDLTTTVNVVCGGVHTDTPDFTTTEFEKPIPVIPANGGDIVACPALAVPPVLTNSIDVCGNIIVPELISTVDVPVLLTCEGTRTYTYHYEDCSGYIQPWTYTYTIEYEDFTIAAAPGGSIVQCPNATDVVPIYPVVTDNCLNVLTPTHVATPKPSCEGIRSYIFTYTDCSGFTHDWVYTYAIEYEPIPNPTDQMLIVDCPDDTDILPTPPDVFDNCGVELVPSMPVISAKPTCEGMRTYTYNYVDCEGTTQDWVFTYQVVYEDFTIPGDDGEIVDCVSDINIGSIIPPSVVDNCLVPILPAGPSGPVINPVMFNCEGTYTYTWTYMDCTGNTKTWNYVYTVDQGDPSEFGGPVPTSSIIECANDAMPPALPVVQDDCGNVIPAPTPVIGGTYAGGCGGTITYTYLYMNCPGLQFEWVYTYYIVCQQIQVKVFLQGPYDVPNDEMTTLLNVHHLLPGQDKLLSPELAIQLTAPFTPFGQPYSADPWSHPGTEGDLYGDASAPGAPVGVQPYPADVVDWVLVTVTEDSFLVVDRIWSCAGWVLSDGTVVFPEDCGNVPLDPGEEYYILVEHRNHLAVLSPEPVDMLCGGEILSWDFTTSNSYQPIFRFGQIEVEPGVWAMYAGNGEQEISIQAINSADHSAWAEEQGLLGYKLTDFNLNRATTSPDEAIWNNNQNKTTAIPFPN